MVTFPRVVAPLSALSPAEASASGPGRGPECAGLFMDPILVLRLCVSPRPGRQFLTTVPLHQACTLGRAHLLTLLCFSKDALGYSRVSAFPYQFYAQFVNF